MLLILIMPRPNNEPHVAPQP